MWQRTRLALSKVCPWGGVRAEMQISRPHYRLHGGVHDNQHFDRLFRYTDSPHQNAKIYSIQASKLFSLVHTRLIKSVAGSVLLNSMSFLYPKSTTITLAPWFQFVPWVGGHILNGVSKHLCCVLNWIECTFATWSNVLIFFNLCNLIGNKWYIKVLICIFETSWSYFFVCWLAIYISFLKRFLERGRERERKGEEHGCVRGISISCLSHTPN